MRFVLLQPEEGNQGYLIWKDEKLEAQIDWNDPVVKHGMAQCIKYARLIQRKASSPQAQGADREGFRYFVQLALEGTPYRKPKHQVGGDIIGADLGPSTIALVPRTGPASLSLFCEELAPDEQAIRRLQRKMDRQRGAANPENYDGQGRVRKGGKTSLRWKSSKTYQKTRQRKAAKERRLSAHHKSLHAKKAHEIVAVGNTILLEKISYKSWQKQYGRSVGLRAPGMFVEQLRRTGAAHGRHPDRSSHTQDQVIAILSWLRAVCQKASARAGTSVRLWRRSDTARPVFRESFSLSRSNRSYPLMCPVCRVLGRCGGAEA